MSYTTSAQAQADLDIVNAAISDLVQGKRRKMVRFGNGNGYRLYEAEQITYDSLVLERQRLEGIVASLTPCVQQVPRFRPNTTFSLNVTKKPV